MHYRNGREAKNGDKIVSLGMSNGIVEHFGKLHNATPGNDYCNGVIVVEGAFHGENTSGLPSACLCDCLHVEDLADILAEKGLDKRPPGK